MKKYLLTPMQQGILFDCMKAPDGGYYIQQLICSFSKHIDKDILYEAWKKTVENNKVLRTKLFINESGDTTQFFDKYYSFRFDVFDSSEVNKESFLKDQRYAKRDILKDDLWSVTVLCSDEKTEMIWCFHHIILDGRSHSLIIEEVLKTYNSIVDNINLKDSDSVDFSEYLKVVESLEIDCDFWNKELGAISLASNLDIRKIVDQCDSEFVEQESSLSEQETLQVVEFCKNNSYSVNCLFQSAWAFIVHKYKFSDDVVFGTTRACRHLSGKDFSSTRGMLINTVPFAVHVDDSMTVGDLLSQTKETQVRLRSAEGSAMSDISACLESKYGVDLFKSILVFENHDINEHLQQLSGICEGMKVELREKVNSLTVAGYLGTKFKFTISYSLSEYKNIQMEHILKCLKTIMLDFAQNPDGKLGDINFLESEEKQIVLKNFTGTESGFDFSTNIVKELERQSKKCADRVAVELADLTTISYRKLNARANQLANYLLSLGYKKGDCISVCMDRCLDLIVSMLAIWKAGMVYVPVDTSGTRERMLFYISDSSSKVVLTLDRLSQNIPDSEIEVIVVDREEYIICKQNLKNINVAIDPLDVAYILYTSGSTGIPKGVEVYHRGIVPLVEETRDILGMVETDRILIYSTPSFDVSLYEILMGLFVGATLCIERWENLISGETLAKTFVDREITAVSVTPTVIMDAPILDGFKLRMVMCCGEVCNSSVFEKWGDGCSWRFFNGYGPTEVTIWSTTQEYKQGESKLTIGRPIKDRLCYVLDDNMNVLPVGVPGELYIGGIGVAKGYLNRPDVNRESFFANPFVEGDIIYKTGDLVRLLYDGRLDFIQRVDNQVKIFGLRIELEEIESVIDSFDGVVKSAVVVLDDNKTVGAFIQTIDNADVSDKLLKNFLAISFPSVFIPKVFFKIEHFPTTASQKIDRVLLKKELQAFYDNQEDVDEEVSALVSDENREKVLHCWNATEMELPDCKTVLPIIQNVISTSPDSVAIIDKGRGFSFKDLDEASNRVASYLKSQGIGVGDVVATFIDKSFEYIYTTFGIMKSGAVFVPLCFKYPVERIRYIVEDSGCKCVLTSCALKKDLSVDVDVAVVDELEECIDDFLCEEFNIDSPAYIIYTSGSTGKPKGVLCSHIGLLNLCTFYKNRLNLKSGDRAGMVADVSFDASLADIWPYLCVGGTVCITDDNTVIDFHKLLEWFIRDGVTVSFISTVLAEMFFVAPGLERLPLRYLLTGGDTLHSFPPEGYPCEVINTYGPTENTVDSTWYVVPQGDSGRPPIGRPIGNVRAYILNADLLPVDLGQKGELCLAGNQLALKYLNRPDLTDEKFVIIDIDGKEERVYRTGDVASWMDSGDIEFHGRSDNQIQICGVRTELGEVEGTMLQYDGVMEAAVVPVFDGNVIYALAGFYSVANDASFDKKGFDEFLKSKLPAVLVPKKNQQMQSLPKNFAGKIDRKSLKVPKDIIIGDAVEFKFENEMEKKLLPIWAEVLNYPALTPTDNFFDVGGHSILMLKLVAAIEKKLNIDIDVSTLMQAHTVRGLADAIKDKRSNYASKYAVDIKSTGNKVPVFCVAGIGGGSHWFRDFRPVLSEEQPFYCLEFLGLPDDVVRGSVEGMAEEFLKAIRDIQPNGPYIIGGFSDGGCVSFEIERQLREQGEEVQMFFLIDAYGPNIDRRLLSRISNYIKHFIILSWQEKLDFFKEKYEWKCYQLKHMLAKKEVKSDYDEIWEIISIQHDTVLNYNYRKMPGSIELFRAEKPPRSMPLDPEAGWSGLAEGGINIHITPGDHYSIFKVPQNEEFVKNFEELIRKNS